MIRHYSTPLGWYRAEWRGDTLISFKSGSEGPVTDDALHRYLRAYFDGQPDAEPMPDLNPGGTDFQREVWDVMRAIPFGKTRTYGDIAHQLGRPDAIRAVGQASARNPIWLLIPCHRVIAKSGGLQGYAGGLDQKAWLLAHERGERSLF